MDSSPSKRRKLSSAGGLAVDATNTDLTPTTREARALTPGRASFMSPTKSSLARYNPDLLPRAQSAGHDGQRTDSNASALTPRKLNAVPLRPTTPNSRPARMSASPIRAGSASPRRSSTRAVGGSLSAPPRRSSRTPGRPSGSNIPPVPQTAVDENELAPADGLTALANSELLQNSKAVTEEVDVSNNDVADTEQQGEPELPPTPEQLGLKPLPSPPRGFMSSSPSARLTKRKGRYGKSSPLKPRPLPPRETQKTPAVQENDKPSEEQTDLDKEQKATEEDFEETKRRRTLLSLENQLLGIQADVAILEQAVLTSQESGKLYGSQNLVSILTSTNPLHKPLPAAPKPLTVSAKISFFLPFFKRPLPKEDPPPAEDLPSYHPIEVENRLEELRAFHPLTVISSEDIVGPSIESQALLRQQDITLASPSLELQARLRLTINTTNDSVEALALENLSSWADQELGSWMRQVATTGDVSSIGWACGRYWDVSYKRAAVWAQCCEKYSHLVSSKLTGREPLREKDPQQKAGSRDNAGDDANDDDDDDSPVSRPVSEELSRAQLRLHLGRQALQLSSSDGVSLVFRWEIGLDWTGEAQSRLNVDASFPKIWTDIDQRKSLGKLEGTFKRLVRERGVRDAIRIIVGVVFPA